MRENTFRRRGVIQILKNLVIITVQAWNYYFQWILFLLIHYLYHPSFDRIHFHPHYHFLTQVNYHFWSSQLHTWVPQWSLGFEHFCPFLCFWCYNGFGFDCFLLICHFWMSLRIISIDLGMYGLFDLSFGFVWVGIR